jgi:class 3 adenylate cyclase
VPSVDVVGDSRQSARDEAGTLARPEAGREEVIGRRLGQNRGRLVKLIGDGALYGFASAADALACAVEIQQAMAARETDRHERLRLRIGADLGDVIVDGHDICGHGVNVAARLEALAEPGGVCVSG